MLSKQISFCDYQTRCSDTYGCDNGISKLEMQLTEVTTWRRQTEALNSDKESRKLGNTNLTRTHGLKEWAPLLVWALIPKVRVKLTLRNSIQIRETVIVDTAVGSQCRMSLCDEESYRNLQNFAVLYRALDRLCGLVVRVLGYRSGGSGFDSLHYQKKNISGSGTGSTQPRDYNWGATW
jgi:hypothetical protein